MLTPIDLIIVFKRKLFQMACQWYALKFLPTYLGMVNVSWQGYIGVFQRSYHRHGIERTLKFFFIFYDDRGQYHREFEGGGGGGGGSTHKAR